MPLELKYLPIIESALNPKAVSRVGAKGLWQFMFQTGKSYGLKANNYIDERFDPMKSTQAAIRYLRDLYKFFQSWDLAIAAYNCGPGNVKKAILFALMGTIYSAAIIGGMYLEDAVDTVQMNADIAKRDANRMMERTMKGAGAD